MKLPSEVRQYGLPQSISVPGRTRTVIRRPIAFDSNHVTARSCLIQHRDVNEEPGATYLGLYGVAEPLKRLHNVFFKW
jgi:hypothetical protein